MVDLVLGAILHVSCVQIRNHTRRAVLPKGKVQGLFGYIARVDLANASVHASSLPNRSSSLLRNFKHCKTADVLLSDVDQRLTRTKCMELDS